MLNIFFSNKPSFIENNIKLLIYLYLHNMQLQIVYEAYYFINRLKM